MGFIRPLSTPKKAKPSGGDHRSIGLEDKRVRVRRFDLTLQYGCIYQYQGTARRGIVAKLSSEANNLHLLQKTIETSPLMERKA